MKRVAMVCGALGSLLMVFGCGSSDNSPSGSGGAPGVSSAGSPGTNMAGSPGTNMAGSPGTNMAGSPGTTGGSYASSLPGSKVLGSLSDAEVQTWCSDISKSDAVKSFTDFSCRIAGLLSAIFSQSDTEAQTTCQSAYSSCVADPAASQCSRKPTASCQATVAEYDACLNDEIALVKTAAAQIPMCSTLTLAALQGGGGGGDPIDQTPPASCQLIQQKCPEALSAMN